MAIGAGGGGVELFEFTAGGNFNGPFWPHAESINIVNITNVSEARLRADFSIQ